MLTHLTIRDYLLVERVELDFSPGLTVLTGETGAGKSILIDALALALGERAEGSVVRGAAARAEISAEFHIADMPPLRAWLAECAIDCDDEVLILRRSIEAGGRSRGFINGTSVTLAQLKQAAEFLLDIHGQHAYHALLRRPAQRQLLDRFAKAEALVDAVGAAWQSWQGARARREYAAAHGRDRKLELDATLAALEALQQLGDDLARWDELQGEHARLAHVTHLTSDSQFLIGGLDENEDSLHAQLHAFGNRLDAMAEVDSALHELAQLLHSASAQIDEVVHGLRRYADRLSPDPERLDLLDRRMSDMHQLARKHQTQPEALPTVRDALQARVHVLSAEDDIAALEAAEQAAHAGYDHLAARLAQQRRQAARELSTNVSAAIQELALKDGVFEIAFLPVTEPRVYGLEEVEFQVAAHPDAMPAALAKIASGGELSRIGLAIQTALSDGAGVPTLIFDEVDVGIGGAVAESVGRRLARLGLQRQVLVITHLPQVAARGAQHFRVAKHGQGTALLSQIELLDPAARVEEIARMLGGLKITTTTRQHAAEMLAG
jgi:DNA repair protein RecN (Recombination protein N)